MFIHFSIVCIDSLQSLHIFGVVSIKLTLNYSFGVFHARDASKLSGDHNISNRKTKSLVGVGSRALSDLWRMGTKWPRTKLQPTRDDRQSEDGIARNENPCRRFIIEKLLQPMRDERASVSRISGLFAKKHLKRRER